MLEIRNKMKKLLLAYTLCLILFCQPSFAEVDTVKALVERGLNAYIKDGANAFIKTFLQGSALEGNPQAPTQAKGLEQIEDFYGKPESYDIVRISQISPRSQMVIFTTNHAKGVVFGKVQVYLLKSGQWVTTNFNFNTDANALLPSELVYGK